MRQAPPQMGSSASMCEAMHKDLFSRFLRIHVQAVLGVHVRDVPQPSGADNAIQEDRPIRRHMYGSPEHARDQLGELDVVQVAEAVLVEVQRPEARPRQGGKVDEFTCNDVSQGPSSDGQVVLQRNMGRVWLLHGAASEHKRPMATCTRGSPMTPEEKGRACGTTLCPPSALDLAKHSGGCNRWHDNRRDTSTCHLWAYRARIEVSPTKSPLEVLSRFLVPVKPGTMANTSFMN